MAEEVAFYSRQQASYLPRAGVSADITDWQNYVLERLRCTKATLISLEPHKPLAKGVFTVIEMELVAKGGSYREFADFIDRLEHGERIVRIEKLRMEKQQTSIYVTCLIRGLVKNGAKPAAKPAAADPIGFVGPLPPAAALEPTGAAPDGAQDAARDAAPAEEPLAAPDDAPAEERDD
jgi:hypothetical protein